MLSIRTDKNFKNSLDNVLEGFDLSVVQFCQVGFDVVIEVDL